MLENMDKQAIRVGTLVQNTALPEGMGFAEYIKFLLPFGFESFELSFWQTLGGVDLAQLADEVLEALDGSGAIISCVDVFGNPLESGEKDVETLKALETVIDNVHRFGTDMVAGFTGRMRGQSIPDSLPRFTEVWMALCDRSAKNDVKVAFENCDMGGTWETGDWNIAHNPAAWELMFDAVKAEEIGLEWEPCHQMVHLIDPIAQLAKWVDKVYHVHGKCATIRHDIIREYGIDGPKQWAFHRTPGFGDCNWTDVISILRMAGYEGSIDIEGWHDPVYRGDLEITGQVHALSYLKRCRGGDYVPLP